MIEGLDYDGLKGREYRKKGIIAMIDACGISQTTDDLATAEKFITTIYLCRDSANKLIETTYGVVGHRIADLPKPSVVVFQDTILLEWEVPEKNADLIAAAVMYLGIVIVHGLQTKFLFRGSVSYGEYIHYENAKENIVLGPAVNEAHNQSQLSHWGGVFIVPSCRHYVEDVPYSVIPYEVPQKSNSNGELGLLPCCGWPRLFCLLMPSFEGNLPNQAEAKKGFDECLDGFNYKGLEDSIKKKYTNTKVFFDWYIDNHYEEIVEADDINRRS